MIIHRSILSFCASMLAVVLFHLPAQSQRILFSEDFNGHFSQRWRSTARVLPDQSLEPFRPVTVVHQGTPSADFTEIDGASVFRMSTAMPPFWTRYGYLSNATVHTPSFELEARINTLDQGGLNMDGLFDLWLVNSQDKTHFVNIGMFGDRFDTKRSWYYSTSSTPIPLSDPGDLPPFAYDRNTWYRLRITQIEGKHLRVSIWNDSGNTELVSHVFEFGLNAIGTKFNIGFSQWIGKPDNSHSLLSAVDYTHVRRRRR